MKPKALIIRTAGTNCDYETQYAFTLAGAQAERVHINRLISGEVKLKEYQILALPGGFSYGDDIASGKILANELKYKLGDMLSRFDQEGKPVIGICNGFQVLAKMGMLPGEKKYAQTTTLTFNDSDKFESRWVYLATGRQKTKCLWTQGLPPVIQVPVAHGEGKFVALDNKYLDKLEANSQVVFRYCDKDGDDAAYPLDPNGSQNHIAGITNERGNILGLMPHPERAIFSWQHLDHAAAPLDKAGHGWGLKVFQNAVDYIK
ncbi:MAG: phosphoribosylformylglycinamidine synthase I [Elusimicrobia bacterium RIFOXYB2_FULL_49_7]|nr:MAG: phosphoribosylformylglycinamidine synthase I [Elusimicrobia bacterium RIFOXYB2_FULL_49_7]